MSMKEFNEKIIAEFRENAGVVGGLFDGIPLLLLATRGVKSGLMRISPLAYVADGDRYIVAASNAGAANDPPWYRNVVADDAVEVEVGSEHFAATASPLEEPERTAMYAKLEESIPTFANYRTKTARTIPVVALTRAP